MNKTQILSFLLLILLLFPVALKAEDTSTIIKGRAESYAGDTIVFHSFSNMISFSEMEMGRTAVDDSGFFECSISLSETQHIFSHLGIYNCYLYGQPGMIYNVQLPQKREKNLQDIVNPYFEETSIHLSVHLEGNVLGKVPPQDEELNFTIRAFNDSFYPYYYKFVINAYGNRVDRMELIKAEEEVRSPFDSINESFLKDYIDYRIGLLNHYGAQVSNQNIIRDYYLGKPVLSRNPAYMELFNQVFKDYFIEFFEEHPGSKLPSVMNREKDYTKLNSILIKDGLLENDTLRELVMLKGFYDGFYDGNNIPSSMVQMLDSVRYHSSIEKHSRYVKDIMLEITKLLPGYMPPDFALYNSDSTLIHLSDFKDGYVYLNFCNSFGYYCVREYEYLKVLKERLKDRISIVTILVDDNFENMKELVESNNYPWTFLHFSNQPEVVEDYDIQAYPSYFLIGPTGNLILSPAPSPAENFELTFLTIYSNQEP